MKIIFFYILLFAEVFYAQSNPVDLLKSVQEKFKEIRNLSADIIQTVNSDNPRQGKLFFKKPESYRLEISNQIIITDGKTFWNYNKNQKKVIIDNYQKTEDNIFSINYLLFDVPNKSNISSSVDGEFKKLTLKSKETSFPYLTIELWIDSDRLIKKVKAIDNSGTSYEIQFNRYNINQNLRTDLFSFNPPEGTKVIDLR